LAVHGRPGCIRRGDRRRRSIRQPVAGRDCPTERLQLHPDRQKQWRFPSGLRTRRRHTIRVPEQLTGAIYIRLLDPDGQPVGEYQHIGTATVPIDFDYHPTGTHRQFHTAADRTAVELLEPPRRLRLPKRQ
jgi:hypothetical protein